jgi:hypothetical protein
MRGAQGFAPEGETMSRPSIGPALLMAAVLAAAAAYVVPRGIEARALLGIEADPARIADRALDAKFNAAVAQRGIELALADKDADLAKSFVELAAARQVALDPALIEEANAAAADAASTKAATESFALGSVSGEPRATAGLAGTTLGEAVKLERAGGLMHVVRDVGRIQKTAGMQAALDGLTLAESPREMGRLATLAEKEGGKTRAILKVVGRGAIQLTGAVFDLLFWMLGALLAVVACVSSLKSAVERVTLRILRYRKECRQQRFAALTARG